MILTGILALEIILTNMPHNFIIVPGRASATEINDLGIALSANDQVLPRTMVPGPDSTS